MRRVWRWLFFYNTTGAVIFYLPNMWWAWPACLTSLRLSLRLRSQFSSLSHSVTLRAPVNSHLLFPPAAASFHSCSSAPHSCHRQRCSTSTLVFHRHHLSHWTTRRVVHTDPSYLAGWTVTGLLPLFSCRTRGGSSKPSSVRCVSGGCGVNARTTASGFT